MIRSTGLTPWEFIAWSTPLIVAACVVLAVIALLIWKKQCLAAGIVRVVSFLLFAIALPSYWPARGAAQMNACINNLHEIEGAKRAWAAANNESIEEQPSEADLLPFLKGGVLPRCLTGDQSYRIGLIGVRPSCLDEKSRGHKLPED